MINFFSKKHNKKCRICIIDDEELILEMYKTKFEQEGYTVLTAQNGKEGFKIAQAHKPDIILTDILMPGSDGFYLLKKLKSEEVLKKIPVIALTNVNDEERRHRVSKLGVDKYLVKSEHMPRQVAKIVKEVLRYQNAASSVSVII